MTPRQLELLGILQEECAEVIQIISKIRRFGMDSYNPADPSVTNHDLLNLEVGDVLGLIEMLKTDPDILDESKIYARSIYKQEKVLRYLRS